jgi:hypothetical protein
MFRENILEAHREILHLIFDTNSIESKSIHLYFPRCSSWYLAARHNYISMFTQDRIVSTVRAQFIFLSKIAIITVLTVR